ncbi:YxD-tail cyclophane-containing RiPP peptide [Streptomyces prunicolor]|uniref:YxD-tail cyclophane-containing RiPP peptide n=1 Tax=Streptomyces prunicolor TaxID=67348 RepID=UPI00371A5104
MADLARYDGAMEEREVADRAGRYEPGGADGPPEGDHGSLPDRTGADPTALRARVDHPVLGSALATPLTRSSRADTGLVAYHEDCPDEDDDRSLLPDYTGVDLTALRARVDHPVLGTVLATLIARSCHPDGGLVAYHEDSPNAER